MNAVTKIEASPLAKLREPFPPNQISKLPKETRAQIEARKTNKSLMVWKCPVCGGPHHKDAVHLDYVGHAAATDRLLDADPRWTWDPVPDASSIGLPVSPGGMWIKLTVDGVSRYGFGCADGKSGGDAVKEIIGDAIRNAGMRFGMALDLWHKGDLHVEEAEEAAPAQPVQHAIEHQPEEPAGARKPPLKGPIKTRGALRIACGQFVSELHACADTDMLNEFLATEDAVALVAQVSDESEFLWRGDGGDFLGLEKEIERRRALLEMGPE